MAQEELKNELTSGGPEGREVGGNLGEGGSGNSRSNTRSSNSSNRNGKDSKSITREAGQPPIIDLEVGKSDRENGKKNRTDIGTSSGSGGGSEGSDGRSIGSTEGSSDGNQKEIIPKKSTERLVPKNIDTKKVKSKTAPKKDSGDITDSATLSILIQSGFSIVAGVTKREHWLISEEEGLAIAQPASTMIQKLTSAQRKKISQLAAPVMLGSALASVLLPRIMIDLAMTKGQKQNGIKSSVGDVRPSTIGQAIEQQRNNGPVSVAANDAPVSTSVNEEVTELFGKLHLQDTTGNII